MLVGIEQTPRTRENRSRPQKCRTWGSSIRVHCWFRRGCTMDRRSVTSGVVASALMVAVVSVPSTGPAVAATPGSIPSTSLLAPPPSAKKQARGVLRVKVTGTGTYTVRSKGFRKIGTSTNTYRLRPGLYTVKAAGATVKPKKKVRVRKGKKTTVRIRFLKKSPAPRPTPDPTSTPAPTSVPSPTPSESPTQQGNERTVVSDGGAISVSFSGVTVEAPEGAISAGQTLTVRKEPNMVLPRGGVGGSGLTLTTSQGQPSKPVTVTMTFTPGTVEQPLIVHRAQGSNVWVPEETSQVEPGKARSEWESFSSGSLVEKFVYALGELTGNRAGLPDHCLQPPSFVVNHNFSSDSSNVNDSLFSCHTTTSSDDWVGVEFTNNRGYPLMMRVSGGQFELTGASMPTSTVSALNQAISRVSNLGSNKTDLLVLAPGSTTAVKIPRKDGRTKVTVTAQGVVFSSVAGAGLSLLSLDQRLESSVKIMDCLASALHALNAQSTVDEGLSALRACSDALLSSDDNGFLYFPELSPAEFKKLSSGLKKLAKATLAVDMGQRIADAWVDGLYPPGLEYTTERTILPVDPPAHPKTVNTYIARDPDTGRSVLVDRGRVTVIGTGDLFNCLAKTRAVWDIGNLKALKQTPDGTQLSCYDEGPDWTYTPTAQGGNTGINIILRNLTGNAWLINNAGEVQAIKDGGTYLCLARTNPIIWNTPDTKIDDWTPVGTTPAACGGGGGTIRPETITAGFSHSCGVDAGGAAWCWGLDDAGQVGDGDTDQSSKYAPVAVAGGHTFTELTAGYWHTCGVDTDGAAWCWGDDPSGQVGDGGAGQSKYAPVAVAGGHTFTQLTAGYMHTCGVDTDGAAWCWGDDRSGQVGDGDIVDQSNYKYAPVAVTGGHTFTQLTAGFSHSCGVDADGAAWCWGWDYYGQVGDGAGQSWNHAPVAVAGGHTFTQLTAGSGHTCGVDTDGAAWCWGDDFSGQVGDGDIDQSNKYAPVAVTGGHTFTQP